MRAPLILIATCMHEFIWQAFPAGERGVVRDITQWGLICVLCWSVAAGNRNVALVSVCVAAAVMASTTALCAMAWIIKPWPLVVGGESCSQQIGVPILLLSVVAASLAAYVQTKTRETQNV